MSQESEKTIEKKPDSTLKRSRQPELQMNVERKQEREQNAEKKPQIAQIQQEGGMNKVGSHSFSLQINENIQTRLADPKDRPIRRAQQNIQQLDVVRKKVKTESPDRKKSISNRQGLVQSPRYKSYVRQKGDPWKQKADLAHQIIKIIQNPPIHIKQKLLQSQILAQIFDENKYQKQNIQKFLNLFENGVILDNSIYSQQRIKKANIRGKKKIVFYPTTLFTGEIFQRLKNQQQQQIIMGHFGISKTMSTVLYQQLTEFIVDYRIRSQQKHEVNQNCIKVIYWSINMEKDTQQNVKELMWKQFSEAHINFMKKIFRTQDPPKDYNWKEAFLQKKIRIILVVDQLNRLISKIREKKSVYQNPNDNQKDCQFHISQVQKIISKSIKVFDRVVFLSSINVQTSLLQQIQCFKKKKDLNEDIIPISLTEKQQQQQGKLDIISFFVRIFFECFKVNKSLLDAQNVLMETQDNSRSNTKLESQKKQSLIKTIVMQIFNQLIPSEVFYLTQYVVRYYLKIKTNNWKTLKKIENITSLEELKRQIKYHFQMIRKQEMPESLRQYLKKFIKSNPQLQSLKYEFVMQIFRIFEQKYGSSKQTSITIRVDQIKFFQKQNKAQYIEKILDKNIFNFNNAHGGQIHLLIPVEVFLKSKIDKRSVIEYALDYFAELKYETIIEGKNFEIIGAKLQFYLKKVLSLGCTSLILKDVEGQDFRKFQCIQEQYFYFMPIPQHKSELHSKDPQLQKQQKISLGNCIRNGLQIIINKQDHQNIWWRPELNNTAFYVFIPGKKESILSQNTKLSKEKMLEDQNHVSKAIDMMLISFSKGQKKISVNAIDVTISCRSDVINSKLEKFLKCFEEFEDKNETTITLLGQPYQIELNYYVISPENETKRIRHQLEKVQKTFPFGFTYHEKLRTALHLNKQINSKYKLLNEIGHLSLTDDLEMQNKSQMVVDFKVYEKLSKEHFKDQINKKPL